MHSPCIIAKRQFYPGQLSCQCQQKTVPHKDTMHFLTLGMMCFQVSSSKSRSNQAQKACWVSSDRQNRPCCGFWKLELHWLSEFFTLVQWWWWSWAVETARSHSLLFAHWWVGVCPHSLGQLTWNCKKQEWFIRQPNTNQKKNSLWTNNDATAPNHGQSVRHWHHSQLQLSQLTQLCESWPPMMMPVSKGVKTFSPWLLTWSPLLVITHCWSLAKLATMDLLASCGTLPISMTSFLLWAKGSRGPRS